MKAINKEQVTSKAGKPYWKLTLDDGRKCSMWEGGESVPLDTELDNTYSVIENNGYLNLKSKLQPPTFVAQRRAGMAEAVREKQAGIRESQERKNEAIRIAGVMRDATLISIAELAGSPLVAGDFQDRWMYWQKWLEEQGDRLDDYTHKPPQGV